MSDEERKGPVEVTAENRISDVIEEAEETTPAAFIAIHWNRETGGLGVDAQGFLNEFERAGFVAKFCNAVKYESILERQRQVQAAENNGQEKT